VGCVLFGAISFSNAALAATETFQKEIHYMTLQGKATKSADNLEIHLASFNQIWDSPKGAPRIDDFMFAGEKIHGRYLNGKELASSYGVLKLSFSINNKGNQVIEMDEKTKVVIEYNGRKLGAYNANAYFNVVNSMSAGTMSSFNRINGAMYPNPTETPFEGLSIYPNIRSEYTLGFNAPSRQEGNHIYWTHPYDEHKQKPVIIHLYGVPVKVNSSGNVTKRANFTWSLYHAKAIAEYRKEKKDFLSGFLQPPKEEFVKLIENKRL